MDGRRATRLLCGNLHAGQRCSHAQRATRVSGADLKLTVGVVVRNVADRDTASDCGRVGRLDQLGGWDVREEHAGLRGRLVDKIGAAGLHAAKAAAVLLSLRLPVLNGVDAGERKARVLVIQKVTAAREKGTVVSARFHIQLSSRHRGEHAHTQGARSRARRDGSHLEVARVYQSTQVPVIASVYKTTISQCSVLRHAAWQSFRAPARLQMPVSKSSSQPIPTLELPLQTLLASSRGGGGSQ
eukprot:scaffold100339_cov75-Phaeocystis_antarctica.AAC.3